MSRPGVSKKKKSPRPADLRELKKELKRVTEQLESRDRELEQRNARVCGEAAGASDSDSQVLGIISRRRRTCSRSSTPSSRARAQVCGIDDVVLRLREGTQRFSRAHFGPYHTHRASRSVSMTTVLARMREHGDAAISPTAARRTFPR